MINGGHSETVLGRSGVRTYNPSGIILSGNAGREDSEERCAGIPLKAFVWATLSMSQTSPIRSLLSTARILVVMPTLSPKPIRHSM